MTFEIYSILKASIIIYLPFLLIGCITSIIIYSMGIIRSHSVALPYIRENAYILLFMSIILSFLSNCIFNYLVINFYPIIMKNRTIIFQIRHLGTVNNFEIIVKYISLAAPIFFTLKSRQARHYIGLVNIQCSIKYCTTFLFGTIILMTLVNCIFTAFLTPDVRQSFYKAFTSIASHNLPLFFLTCAIVAICSEFFFRGFVYSALKERSNTVLALLAESILAMSFIGWKPDLYIMVFLDECLLTLLFDRTKSLYPSITVHFSFLLITAFL